MKKELIRLKKLPNGNFMPITLFLCHIYNYVTKTYCDPNLEDLGIRKPKKICNEKQNKWWEWNEYTPRLRALNAAIKRLTK